MTRGGSTHAGVERLLVPLGLLELDSEGQPVSGEGAGTNGGTCR